MIWPRFLTFPRPADFVIGPHENPYLLRWWIIPRNRWLNIYLHEFRTSDDDRALHDHPWINLSCVLKGKYLEWMPDGEWRICRPFRPVVRHADALHRVELIDGKHVWSLFITGPVVREWGFACPKGWKHWKDFVSERDGGNERGAGCE